MGVRRVAADFHAPDPAASAGFYTDEPRGVRRFFVRDPDGNVIDVLGHRPS